MMGNARGMKKEELSELKEHMEEIRNRLNHLMRENNHHVGHEILNLSQQLDRMIYRYMMG